MNISEALSLAVQHHGAGRLREAEAVYRQILQAQDNHPDALHLLGVLANQTRRHDMALELIQRAIVINGQNPHYHANLGNVFRALGKLNEAIGAYARAIEIDPNLVIAYSNLGVVLQELGRLDEAAAAYRRATEIKPDYADAHYNLGTALKDMGRLDDAIAALRQSVQIQPDSAQVYVVLAGYLLEQGDSGAALEACDACLGLDPANRLALALKSITLDELGQREAARFLVDFDRLIQRTYIKTPVGFSSLAEFNAALAQHIRTHPSMISEPQSGATRFGMHTEELLVEPKGPFSIFEQVINNAVKDYLRSLPTDPQHPYLAQSPQRWRLSVWGVVLGTQGHQVPHMHPDGWVSGVYYVKLPETVNAADGNQAGWIEFGHPPAEFHSNAKSEVRLIQPEEGMLLLFPSYFYHRTVPFESAEERISVAFDVLPKF